MFEGGDRGVGSEACCWEGAKKRTEMVREELGVGGVVLRTHMADDFGVGDVVRDNLGHFGEIPTVPFLQARKIRRARTNREKIYAYLHSHGVNVDFFVEIVKESDSLNDHCVDLVRGELELVSVGKLNDFLTV